MNLRRISLLCLSVCMLVLSYSSAYSQEFDKVEISTIKVSENIYMLQGAGGNIGVCVGDDGVFMIDDQFAPLTAKIKSAIAKLSSKKVRFVINTHWHYDHVGGNENMGEAGAVIVAHQNVRKRMSTDQFMEFFNKKVPTAPKTALPVITFTRDITFHLNDEETRIFHAKEAHTDGDAIVFFEKSNVIHTGDIYFSGMYPFIDKSSHGSVDGMIKAARHILDIIDDDTKVIPGHGPLSNKAELAVFVEMLVSLRAKMSAYISNGKTLEEIKQIGLSKDLDPKWGGGFLSPDKFTQILYEDLSRNK